MVKSSKYSFLSFVFLILLTLLSLQFVISVLVSASPVTKMYVNPQDQTVSSSFTVDINVTDVTDLYDWEFNLNYSTSIITATSITEGPFLKSDIGTLWVGDGGDNIYKVYTTIDPEATAGSWGTTPRPFGVTYVNGFLYYVDYGTDRLYNKTLTGGDGSPASWSIVGYSGDAYGLGWNGTHFLIADRSDDKIYFADSSDPTTSVKSIAYTGIKYVESVAFDGTYIWAGDTGNIMVYKLDQDGTIITSWSTAGVPNGLTYDGTNLWVCESTNLYKYSEAGSLLGTYTAPAVASEGLASHFGPRSTYFLSQVDDANGHLDASATIVGDVPGLVGDGTLATINFDIDSAGTSDLDIHETILEAYNFTGDKTLDRITHVRYDGSVTTTGVPEFPLGATAEIALAAVIIYLWWRRRKTKLYKSPAHLGSSVP